MPLLFPALRGARGKLTQARTAADAGPKVFVYVQISHSVTKVLIRKWFRTFPSGRRLTNLET